MKRREQREHIFRMLFRREFHGAEEMPRQVQFYFVGIPDLTEEDRKYIEGKYEAVSDKEKEIDEAIEKAAKGWRLQRMGRVELTIMRLACYEMRYDEDVPVSVAINEAVELAKKYGSDEAPAFVNGILAKLVTGDK